VADDDEDVVDEDDEEATDEDVEEGGEHVMPPLIPLIDDDVFNEVFDCCCC
jgi:hypothetical protein